MAAGEVQDRTEPGAGGRIGLRQWIVFVIAFLIVLIDGYDTQVTAFAAPLMREDLGGGHGALGLVLSAALLGGLIGGLVLGPLGDRFGRKSILIPSLLIVMAGSLATSFAHGAAAIGLLRLATGIGLGGLIPAAIALTAQNAPPGRRASIVAMAFSGFPLGAVAGSVVGAVVLPSWGWRPLFVIGAAAPAMMLFATAALIPNSPRLAAGAGRGDEPEPVNPVPGLFAEGRGVATLLSWAICFMGLLATYCVVSWLPTLVRSAGLPLQVAVLASGAVNIGSVAGNGLIANLSDRVARHTPAAVGFLAGGALVAMIGLSVGSPISVLSTCFAAGFFAVGAQLTITGLIADFHPPRLVSTGVGWSFSVGQVGGILGPSIAGFLLAAHLGFGVLMMLAGGLFGLCGLALLGLGAARRRAS